MVGNGIRSPRSQTKLGGSLELVGGTSHLSQMVGQGMTGTSADSLGAENVFSLIHLGFK